MRLQHNMHSGTVLRWWCAHSGKHTPPCLCVTLRGIRYCCVSPPQRPCPAGYYCADASTIMPCPGGTSTNGVSGAVALSSCAACPNGTYTLGGAPSCLPCPPGAYCPNPAQIQQCSPGTYSATVNATSAETCTPCTTGYVTPMLYSSTTTEVAYAYGNTACLPCPAGAYCTGATDNTAVPCPGGRYSPGGLATCLYCSSGVGCFGGNTDNQVRVCVPSPLPLLSSC